MRKSSRYGWLVILLGSALLAGCSAIPSVFTPMSPTSQQIYRLIWIIFSIAAVVFLVVEGILLYAAWRFSRKSSEAFPKQVEGNQKLEIAWTMAPAVVLAAVFIISLPTLRYLTTQPASDPGPGGKTALRVHVIAHQWWWEFQYPDLKIVTANELYVPVGTVVNIDLESKDVIHSFWIPPLGGKIDVIPGQVNHTWFQVTQAGAYVGQCSEFCGIDHAFMRFEVVAEPQDQFDSWTRLMQASAAVMTGEAAQGEQVFLAGACSACHTVSGTAAQGKVGPDLTHFASRTKFAGWTEDNTPENLAKWLADPQSVQPGTLMPNLHLPPDQIQLLVTYLESLK